MAKHPTQEAWGFSASHAGTLVAEDAADAIETYTPFVALSVSDITGRDLERTKVVHLITSTGFAVYHYDATNTDPEDGDLVIWDSEDRPFVKQSASSGGGSSSDGGITLIAQSSGGTVSVSDTARGYEVGAIASNLTFNLGAAADRARKPFTVALNGADPVAYTITVDFDGSETCRGAGTFVFESPYQVVTFHPNVDEDGWIIA